MSEGSWYQVARYAGISTEPETDAHLRERVLYLIDGPERRRAVEVAHGEKLERFAAEVKLRRLQAHEVAAYEGRS